MNASLLALDKAVPRCKPVTVFFLFASTFAVGIFAASLPFPDESFFWVPYLISAAFVLFLSFWILRRAVAGFVYYLFEDRFLIKRVLFGRERVILRVPLSDVIAMGRICDLPSFHGRIHDCTSSLTAKKVSFGLLFRYKTKAYFVILECRPAFAASISHQACSLQSKSLS